MNSIRQEIAELIRQLPCVSMEQISMLTYRQITQLTRNTMTPGPWQQHDWDHCPLEIWGNLEGPMEDGQILGTQICEVLTNEADAKLIAAAPELLEACQKAIAFLRSIGNVSYPSDAVLVGTKKILERAIRKAT